MCNDADAVRALFSQLIGKKVDEGALPIPALPYVGDRTE
jgi:hypothetical protein